MCCGVLAVLLTEPNAVFANVLQNTSTCIFLPTDLLQSFVCDQDVWSDFGCYIAADVGRYIAAN